MTAEEAIKYIIRHCNPDYPKGKTEWETAINMAISALEKQIPMKPKQKKRAEEQPLKGHVVCVIPCGNCGEYLNRLHYYCPWCGQKIDYGDDENDE